MHSIKIGCILQYVKLKKNETMNLENLTLKELQILALQIEKRIKKIEIEARNIREIQSRRDLKEGDIIQVSGKKFMGEVFEVLKLNPKKVQCSRENGEVWNVPYCHIIMS